MIDLERIGKKERQPRNSWISSHTFIDVEAAYSELGQDRLIVRTDPLNHDSESQFNRLLDIGVKNFMLPMFRSESCVKEFCKLIKKNNGKIPKPFSKLVELISSSTGTDSNAMELARPRGLDKELSTFTLPREIISFNPENGGLSSNPVRGTHADKLVSSPKLFMGYVPRSKKLEIIAWNQTKKQFDFILIKNYSPNGEPEIVYPKRDKCLSCHQHGGPIFPRFPWTEISSGVPIGLDNNLIDLESARKTEQYERKKAETLEY